MITIEEIGKKENKKEEEQKVLMTYLHPKRIKDMAEKNQGMKKEVTILITMTDGWGETK